MSKLLYICFTKLIINHFLSCNKNIPRRSDSEIHSEDQDLPLTKLANTVKGNFKFGMVIPNIMINDAFKQSAVYKYYKANKAESEKAKATEELKEQHVSPVKRAKENKIVQVIKKQMSPTHELAKSISIKEQRRQQREIMTQLTIDRKIENDVEDTYAEWGQKLKAHKVEDPTVHSLLDLRKGSKASRLESLM
ncbi:hypothetical protein Tco_0166670 [Tanacetum coccineum]